MPRCQGARVRGREGGEGGVGGFGGLGERSVARDATGRLSQLDDFAFDFKRIEHAGEGFFCTSRTIDCAPA